MAAPPVPGRLDEALDSEAGTGDRGDDLAQGPGAGELPVLLAVGDREVVDEAGRQAARGFRAGEVVVVGQGPMAVPVAVDEPLERVAFEQDEPAAWDEQPRDNLRPGVQVL